MNKGKLKSTLVFDYTDKKIVQLNQDDFIPWKRGVSL